MDSMGEQQLHPNWRALATIHIPLKRFVREGTQQKQQGTHSSKSKKRYEIQGVDGSEVKVFYEDLVNEEEQSIKKLPKNTQAFQVTERNSRSSLNKREPFDVSKYHRYAMENNVEKLKELSFEGQDSINVCDCFGWTALMMAACEGSLEAVMFLLELGIDRDIKDKTGKTAKDLARKKGHFHIEQLLERPLSREPARQESSEDEYEEIEPYYCEICKRTFSETSEKRHKTSTLHQFNANTPPSSNRLQKFNIPPRNRGLQLMVKQGWDRESGLGPSHSGRLYPVKTVIRKQRTGLGIDQDPARVTHFQAFDMKAIKRHNSDYYKKKPRNRNDMRREKIREWKREKRLRNELN